MARKSGRTWLYSDPHFYHRNIVKFTNYDGSPLRPWDDADKMTEEMIEWYNELVHPDDRVYILGDVAFTRRALNESVPRLNGRKVLVKGNHDVDKLSYYAQHFDDVRSYVVRKGFVLSHIPLHPDCLGRWGLNIHGHLHGNHITKPYINGSDTPKDDTYDSLNETVRDRRYRNVCVEQTNFRPILLDQVLHEEGLK